MPIPIKPLCNLLLYREQFGWVRVLSIFYSFINIVRLNGYHQLPIEPEVSALWGPIILFSSGFIDSLNCQLSIFNQYSLDHCHIDVLFKLVILQRLQLTLNLTHCHFSQGFIEAR